MHQALRASSDASYDLKEFSHTERESTMRPLETPLEYICQVHAVMSKSTS